LRLSHKSPVAENSAFSGNGFVAERRSEPREWLSRRRDSRTPVCVAGRRDGETWVRRGRALASPPGDILKHLRAATRQWQRQPRTSAGQRSARPCPRRGSCEVLEGLIRGTGRTCTVLSRSDSLPTPGPRRSPSDGWQDCRLHEKVEVSSGRAQHHDVLDRIQPRMRSCLRSSAACAFTWPRRSTRRPQLPRLAHPRLRISCAKRPSERSQHLGVAFADSAVLQVVPARWAIQDSNLGPLPYQRSALTD